MPRPLQVYCDFWLRDARQERLAHGARRQLTRWSIYRKNCWIFGCHAPYRGGDINLFLAQSADLSAVATARIARAFPFDAKDFLGSAGFPTSTST